MGLPDNLNVFKNFIRSIKFFAFCWKFANDVKKKTPD